MQYCWCITIADQVTWIVPNSTPYYINSFALYHFSEMRQALWLESLKVAALLLGDNNCWHGIGKWVGQCGLQAIASKFLSVLQGLERLQPTLLVLFNDFQGLGLVGVDVEYHICTTTKRDKSTSLHAGA